MAKEKRARPGVITNLDAAEEQIIFWRTHLDIAIEDMFPPIKLTRDQHVLARAFGNGNDIKMVQSRGSGKTWLTALCCLAIGVLYPGSPICVCSGTVAQASLVLGKLKTMAEQNPNIANELTATNQKSLVAISKNGGRCRLKNGSSIEAFALESMRGLRAKVVVVDEAPEIDTAQLQSIVSPIKNYKRDLCFNYGFDDYPTKSVEMTSACPKSNSFYDDFLRVVREMGKGNKKAFACALDYHAAAQNGITDLDFFMQEKARMPAIIFDMEYGTIFVGSNSNSAFPADLVQACRTLKVVEAKQPESSKSRYVLSLDIATSTAAGSDNSIISILKFTEKADHSFSKKLVYMQSFNGKTLDVLAERVRELAHREFPNIEMIIFDARGLGDSFARFFDKEWVDPQTGKEYPPLVPDDIPQVNAAAKKMLHPFRATLQLNQELYTVMRVNLEQRKIELPVNSRIVMAKDAAEELGTEGAARKLSKEEKAVFFEADALQYEMGNIVGKVGTTGNVIYDTAKSSQHKDRYSSLAMGLHYVHGLEETNIKHNANGAACVGVATPFDERSESRWGFSLGLR